MDSLLSDRATKLIRALDAPWRWAPRGTYSHNENPHGLVSFGTAENSLVHEELQRFTREKVPISDALFTYKDSTTGGPELPLLLAQHLNEHFKPSRLLNGSEIRITGSATAMHEILGWAVGDPQDGILTSKPVYGRLELDFGNKAALKMIYADTTWRNAFDPQVVDAFEKTLAQSRAAGRRIRALLIVNPNNPVGRCYSPATLVAIMSFCQRHQIHLISDEIYASSVFSDEFAPFTSVLSIKAGIIDDRLLHVTYGFSKDFGAAGLRLGCVVTRSAEVLQVVQMTARFHNPSGASVAIVSAMLKDRDWCNAFLRNSQRKIGESYIFITKGLQDLGIRFVPANAGFFVYVDLSPYLPRGTADPEFELSQRLLDGGVFLHPKEEHGEMGWYRMVYTQDTSVVAEGLQRMKRVLQNMERDDEMSKI